MKLEEARTIVDHAFKAHAHRFDSGAGKHCGEKGQWKGHYAITVDGSELVACMEGLLDAMQAHYGADTRVTLLGGIVRTEMLGCEPYCKVGDFDPEPEPAIPGLLLIDQPEGHSGHSVSPRIPIVRKYCIRVYAGVPA